MQCSMATEINTLFMIVTLLLFVEQPSFDYLTICEVI